MPGFWKGPIWLKAKLDPDDDQRPLLVREMRRSCAPTDRVKNPELAPEAPQERYVGFGIGGAGNIRKSGHRFFCLP